MSVRVYLSTWQVVNDPDLGDTVVSKVQEVIQGGASYNSVRYSYPDMNASGQPTGTKLIATIDSDDHSGFVGVTGIEDITA
tara:strand:+ start:762 stop:1004 length:243 start_codon:yes stop_codon:yes gene_type:complete